jgi:hypothetical protein
MTFSSSQKSLSDPQSLSNLPRQALEVHGLSWYFLYDTANKGGTFLGKFLSNFLGDIV